MKIRTEDIEDLQKHVELWVAGEIEHLYIAGTPGSGKTHTLKEQTKDIVKCAWIGNCSPLQFYYELYRLRGAEIIILDDIDGLLYQRDGLRLLKELMGAGESTLHWASNRTGPGKQAPKTFKTAARVCVITNDFGTRNTHVQAIQSRAVVLEHAPKAEQTITYAEKNGIITTGMQKQLLGVWPTPLYVSLRDLRTYNTLRKAGQDWLAVYKENINE